MSEIVVIIRPSFKKICGPDACRAALYNHILYRLARKAKTEPDEKVKKGEVFWYASAEDICTDIDEAWCVNKVRKEVKLLAASGLLGQRHNPLRKWDRRFQYFMSEIEGKALLEKAAAEGVCLLHIGLKAEVLHLLHMVNAFDKNGGCICQKEEIDLPDMVTPSTTNGRAITEGTTEESDTEESTEASDEEKGERDMQAMARLWASAHAPPLLPSNVVSMSDSQKMRAAKTATPHRQMAHDDPPPEVQDWESDGMASTAKVPAMPKGVANAAVHAGDDSGAAAHDAGCGADGHTGLPAAHPDNSGDLAGSTVVRRATPAGAKQAPLSLKDETPRPLSEKTLRARYEAHFWQLLEDIRTERGLVPPTYGKTWKGLRENQEGISAFSADQVSDDAIKAGYVAMLESPDAWLRNNFTVMAFFKRLQGLLDAKPTKGKPGKNGKAAPVEDESDPYSFASILKRQAEQEREAASA